MHNLAQLQRDFRVSIQSRVMVSDLEKEIVSDDGFPASARMQVYQNNYELTLVDALAGVFPIVSAFVGQVFTRAALKHFIKENPPVNACLSDYGYGFPLFLKAYEHAAHVGYLADLAQLEWTIHALQNAKEVEQPPGEASVINKNAHFISSEFPLLNLWMVGSGQLQPEAVHVDQGGQTLCILLSGGEVKLLAVTPAENLVLQQCRKGLEILDLKSVASLQEKTILI